MRHPYFYYLLFFSRIIFTQLEFYESGRENFGKQLSAAMGSRAYRQLLMFIDRAIKIE